MASQEHFTTLYCAETGEFRTTRVNKKRRRSFSNPNIKLKLNKYSKMARKVVEWVETKKAYRPKKSK